MHSVRILILAVLLTCGLFLTSLANAQTSGPPPVVVIETSMGRIMVMLDPKGAPNTVENFLKYVDAGFYDGTIFHRVIKSKPYMGRGDREQKQSGMNIVQGGGFTQDLRQKKPLFPAIANESGTAMMNDRGTIAMARGNTSDSATCQFYFNVQDNPSFDRKQSYSKTGAGAFDSTTDAGYCVFGKVIRGMDVVEKIQAVRTVDRGRMEDLPAKTVFIKKAYRAR